LGFFDIYFVSSMHTLHNKIKLKIKVIYYIILWHMRCHYAKPR
jgi:hypothetical protein